MDKWEQFAHTGEIRDYLAYKAEETKVRGFMCKLEIEAPIELMQLMYEGGVGSMNSQGFGCLRVME